MNRKPKNRDQDHRFALNLRLQVCIICTRYKKKMTFPRLTCSDTALQISHHKTTMTNKRNETPIIWSLKSND